MGTCRLSGAFAAAVIALGFWLRRKLGQHALRIAIFGQHPLKTGVAASRRYPAAFRAGQQHGRRLDGRQAVAARLAAQLAIARRRAGPRMTRWHFSIQALRHHSALAWLQVPSSSTMPSMSLRMPRWLSSSLALAVDGDDIAVGLELGDLRRAEIEHRPARGIVDRPAQRLGKARPRQADLQHRILEMQRGQPRGAERPVLLLRMLQDQQRDLVFDRRDAVADAQRQRLAGNADSPGTASTAVAPVSGSDCFDIRPLYASRPPLQQRNGSRRLFCRRYSAGAAIARASDRRRRSRSIRR